MGNPGFWEPGVVLLGAVCLIGVPMVMERKLWIHFMGRQAEYTAEKGTHRISETDFLHRVLLVEGAVGIPDLHH